MSDTWLIMDGNYLCRRAHYAFPDLQYGEDSTGTTYGFLIDIINLKRRFLASQFVFCFDQGRSRRLQDLPTYKERRKKDKLTEEEILKVKAYKRELKRLWQTILPNIGFQNIAISNGFEADDMIAKACQEITRDFPDDQIIIVTADMDMFQLISGRVSCFNPAKKTHYTLQSFYRIYGINPCDWINVKAIAGCRSDDVPGAERVGEKTALKYVRKVLNGEDLKMPPKTIVKIESFMNSPGFARNLLLTRLPYRGTPSCQLTKHQINPHAWRSVVLEFGMRTLENEYA